MCKAYKVWKRDLAAACMLIGCLIQRLPGASGQGYVVTDAQRAVWASYTQQTLGVTMSTNPDILWCGYYSPATMPPINYGNPDANPDPNWGCSYSNTNLSNFNSPVYWTRNKDLPFDKFWEPRNVLTFNVSPQPLQYLNCNNSQDSSLPKLRSGIPFTAYWYSNVAIGPYWVQYLQARGLKERRLWRADLCISVWFNRNGKADEEITLKVTSMGPKLGPTDIRVEPYMYNTYFANRKVLWTFTKCWGNAVLQPRYARKVLDPKVPDWDPVKITGQPLFKSCLPWIVRSYRAQAKLQMQTDPWYNASTKIPRDQWSAYPTVQKPNIIPTDVNGNLRYI